MKIALVSCASKKHSGRHQAQDLYNSPLFRKSIAFVKKEADRWYILSAKYYLLEPKKIIKNYNKSLRMLSREERKKWAVKVIKLLRKKSVPQDEIIILAGTLYRRDIVPKLKDMGYRVKIPLEDKPIGKQLQWLGKH